MFRHEPLESGAEGIWFDIRQGAYPLHDHKCFLVYIEACRGEQTAPLATSLVIKSAPTLQALIAFCAGVAYISI